LKMEAICSSETSVETQQTTRRHIPEDDTLHNHCCENLKTSNPTLHFILHRTEIMDTTRIVACVLTPISRVICSLRIAWGMFWSEVVWVWNESEKACSVQLTGAFGRGYKWTNQDYDEFFPYNMRTLNSHASYSLLGYSTQIIESLLRLQCLQFLHIVDENEIYWMSKPSNICSKLVL
jgi:hypothetical protein